MVVTIERLLECNDLLLFTDFPNASDLCICVPERLELDSSDDEDPSPFNISAYSFEIVDFRLLLIDPLKSLLLYLPCELACDPFV